MRLRVGLLRSAVRQVRELVAHGDMEDALNRSNELRHYFEWIKEDLSLAERRVLFEQIQTLPNRLNRADPPGRPTGLEPSLVLRAC
jgi:hypothetical protein